jgi:hypothetical protein
MRHGHWSHFHVVALHSGPSLLDGAITQLNTNETKSSTRINKSIKVPTADVHLDERTGSLKMPDI